MKVSPKSLRSIVENRYDETEHAKVQKEGTQFEKAFGRLKPSMEDTFRLVEGHELFASKPDPWPGELYSYDIPPKPDKSNVIDPLKKA